MANGWIWLHRQLAEHDLWLAEKFTRGQAWADLLMLANYKDGAIWVRGIEVPVKRGQVGWSEVRLASRWQWSRNKVRRFLDSLRKRKMVGQQTDNKSSIITILNYDEYQGGSTASDTPDRAVNKTANGQHADTNKKDNKGKKDKKKISFVETSMPFRLAEFLFRCVRKNKADFKEPNLQTWAKHADLLLRIDRRDPAEVEKVIRWAQADNVPNSSGFCWAVNILSTQSLRRHYDKLVMAMNRGQGDISMSSIPPEWRERDAD